VGSERPKRIMTRRPLAFLIPRRVRWLLIGAISLSPVIGQAESEVTPLAGSQQEAADSLPLAPTEQPVIFSQQSCNTDCQERQTDCALRCDQDAPCIRRCRAEAEDCTRRCVRAPEAAPPTPAARGLSEATELDVVNSGSHDDAPAAS
jgi:hypothetical protein